MSLVMVTASGEQHGLINSVGNSVKDDGFKHFEPKYKEIMEKNKKADAKLINARYLNKNGPGERLTRPYCRYAGDPIQTWHFIPGKEYQVPKGLVDEVNAKKEMKRSGLLDEKGNPSLNDQEVESIHSFVPTGW